MVLYNGTNGQRYRTTILPPTPGTVLSGVARINPSGIPVTVSVTVIDAFTYTVLGYPSGGPSPRPCGGGSCIHNGHANTGTEPEGIALVDSTGTLVEFLSYEGSFNATNGPASGQPSVDIGVRESNANTAAGTPAGHSLQRAGDTTWDTPRANTKGLPNN